MKISLVSYQQISKEVEIEFPVYYKSEYSDGGYWSETYVMVFKDGTRITIKSDSDDELSCTKEKINLSTDLPEQLFETDRSFFKKLSREGFLQQYNKFMREVTLND